MREQDGRATLRALACVLALAAVPVASFAACPPPHALQPSPAELNEAEALYLPTPPGVVDAMLRMAKVRRGDVLYDLGSGDGRIPIAAARQYGVRAVGIELDGRKVALARCLARERGVEQLVEFRQQDVFKADFSDATVVTVFLFPEMNRRLQPRLLATLRPGTRIVSHRFELGDWMPERREDPDGNAIFLWTVPRHGAR